MKILPLLRNPYLSIIMAFLVLFMSCNQHDIGVDENSFDFQTFQNYKTVSKSFTLPKDFGKTSSSNIELSRELLNLINNELGSELVFPDLVHEAVNLDAETIISRSIEEGWITQDYANLAQNVMNDIQMYDFESAIQNLESNALELSLSSEEFEKVNTFANILMSLDYENPDLFNNTNRNIWRCILAVLALAAATAGLATCVTIVACGVAILLHVNATYGFVDHCLGGNE